MNKRIFLTLFLFFISLNLSFIFSHDFSDYSKSTFYIYENISYEFFNEQNRLIDELEITPTALIDETKNQKILSIESNYDFQNDNNDKLTFDIDTIKTNGVINLKYEVEKYQEFVEIKNKETFPYQKINDFEEYLVFSKYIDLNNEIRQISSEIAQNQNDVYHVAFDVAKWIEYNIEYNLSSILENPNRSSSQVLEDKRGVCREIILLFTSMMRSLNIPTRIVSGVAYTNNEEIIDFIGDNYGGHVWAEVFIDGNWVPFDLTYKQYGFVDSSHLIFKISDEFNSLNPVSVLARGDVENLDIEVNRDYKVELKDFEKKSLLDNLDFDIQFTENISTNSYGYVIIESQNKKDFYFPMTIEISVPKDVIMEEKVFPILLDPNEKEETKIEFKVELLDNYIYTIPFSIYLNNKEIFESNIKSNDDFNTYNKVESQKYEDSELITKINFDCDYVFQNSKIIKCEIKNQGNTIIKNIDICLREDCKEVSLFLFENKKVMFENNKNLTEITLTYKNHTKPYSINLKKIPEVKISATRKTNELLKISYDIENFEKDYFIDFTIEDKFKKSFNDKENFFLYETNKEIVNLNYKVLYKNETLQNEVVLLDNTFDYIFEIKLFLDSITKLFFD